MKYAVGMSGGVDSTVTASILLEEGHEVIGLTMQVWDGSVVLAASARSSCYSPDEAQELEAVHAMAERLGIRHYAIPLATEYKAYVLDYFRREYLAGRTPNPCVQCNYALKFGALLSAAHKAGIEFDRFATGHYARVTKDIKTGRYVLQRALDHAKDQSYFLAQLKQEQLALVRFPLGEWEKSRVRAAARALGLHELAEQPESQDFIGCGSYTPLFEGIEIVPGPIMNQQGDVLGEHKGIIHYTIGQRKGLGLSGNVDPVYVVAIDVKRNAVIVGAHAELLAMGLIATGVNWIARAGLEAPLAAEVRIRSRSATIPAMLSPIVGAPSTTVKVCFDDPQVAVTPGQAVVFYIGDDVLGGGWIALDRGF